MPGLLGLSASFFWTGAPEDTDTGWSRPLIAFACVTCQWHTSPLAGGIAASPMRSRRPACRGAFPSALAGGCPVVIIAVAEAHAVEADEGQW
ncbi:hypothetical protein ACTMTF_08505 [Nonomuraea sp. ZG12]|uniref:hypothetical protein n=1 Tax=Nonomuraea sp. ZG12 TaxID=3452207 RepID=UPI003F8BDC9F